MSWDLIFALIFYCLIILFYLRNKKKFEVQGGFFFIYRTKLGLKLMDKIAKKDSNKLIKKIGLILLLISIVLFILALGVYLKNFNFILSLPVLLELGLLLFIIGFVLFVSLKKLQNISITTAFLGMAFIFIFLIVATIKLILNPASTPALAPVIPGVQVSPELPVLGFWHWIIAILIIAVVHEFSHGIYARFHKIKIKSSGFAFLGPILAAFVEPDEKAMEKKSKKSQLGIFSAGPFSNIVLFVIILLISLLVINPITSSQLQYEGVKIVSIEKNSPFELAGLQPGMQITNINNAEIKNLNDLVLEINKLKPNTKINISTQNETFLVNVAESTATPNGIYLGVSVSPVKIGFKEGSKILGTIFLWLSQLFQWLYVISFGVGLFNLLPIGPVDGGRMFLTLCNRFTTPEKAKKIWTYMTSFCLLLIFINLLPYLIKMFSFFIHIFI